MRYLNFSHWLAASALLLLGSLHSSAFGATGPSCPKGFEPIPSGVACAAANLAGTDGSFSAAVRNIPPPQPCPSGFERPHGVNICIAKNLTLNAIGPMPIVEKQVFRLCPQGFHRAANSTICVASNLKLDVRDGRAVLLGPTRDCPVGFHRPAGSTICIPDNMLAPGTFDPSHGAPCPTGFHRPPGVAICIPKDIVYGPTVPGIEPPLGHCPRNWHRPPNVQFCIPSYEQVNTTGGAGIRLGFTANLCPAGTHEVWFDMPIYDTAGLFVIGHVPTRFCVPDNLEPAG